MRESQQVAVCDAVTLPVLHRLIRETVDRLLRIPVADRAPQSAAPTTEPFDERRELEEVRARSTDLRQRFERRLARRLVAEAGGHREREDRRVVLRGATLSTDPNDLVDCSRTVRVEAALDRLCVLAGECPLRRVVATALRAEDEEAVEPRPIVDRPGIAVGAVRDLVRIANRDPLRHT